MTNYYSKTKKELVNINDMHHQHVWYAFKKLCDRLETLALTQTIWDDAFNPAKDIKVNANSRMVRKLEQELSTVREINKFDGDQIVGLEKEVSRLRKFVALQDKKIMRMYNDQKHKGHRYVFSNIPNDDNGQSLVKAMRFYLNKDTYNMRVRGQYLDKTKLERGESWKTYDDGQPLSKSKCIRLYIDKKRESA